MITLVLPPGARGHEISHGAADFKPYRADHHDPASLWLIDVPGEVAPYLIHNGGFYMADEIKSPASVPAGMARVRMKDGSGGGCGFAGVAYEADDDGVVLVPAAAVAELCESHGFEAVSDKPPAPEKADKAKVEEPEAEPTTVRRVPRA